MTQNLQELDSATIRCGLEAIRTAIEDAYAYTRVQMQEGQYHQSVVHTAFGQFLVHNVRDRIAKIRIPGLVSRFASNPRGTAYHEIAFLEDKLFATISAVTQPDSPPRPARFRSGYASGLQSSFRITDEDEFEPIPPIQPTTVYAQILHGSARESGLPRQQLGFIQVAFPDGAGGYSRPTISLEAFIAEWSSHRPAETEVITEDGDLGVKLRERDHAKQ